MNGSAEAVNDRKPSLARRVGVAGFLFFFVKGLLWIIVPAIAMALT